MVRDPNPVGAPSTRHVGGGVSGPAKSPKKKLKPHAGKHKDHTANGSGLRVLSGGGLATMARQAKAHK